MVNDLKFKKVKDKSDKLTKIDKGMLPNLPFRMCIVGRSGSGKTSALVSLLCDSRYYKNGGWKGTNDLDGGTLYTQFSHASKDRTHLSHLPAKHSYKANYALPTESFGFFQRC